MNQKAFGASFLYWVDFTGFDVKCEIQILKRLTTNKQNIYIYIYISPTAIVMYHGVLIPFQAANQKLCSVIYRNNLFSLHENHIKSGRVHHIQHSNYASYMWSSLALWKTLCIKIGYNVCFKKPKKRLSSLKYVLVPC